MNMDNDTAKTITRAKTIVNAASAVCQYYSLPNYYSCTSTLRRNNGNTFHHSRRHWLHSNTYMYIQSSI